ncbi:MAG: hypothetical protein LC114_01110 [Bryobacterales bacterium]|nr:hypothetical protein [Bryobacterales bacterium]
MEACLRTIVTRCRELPRQSRLQQKPWLESGRPPRKPSPAAEVTTGRYFVGRPAEDDGKPTLEQEVASEPEGLVIAFKNDSRVYFVHEYRVTQRIEGNEVRLEKEPVSSAKRVSTANAS